MTRGEFGKEVENGCKNRKLKKEKNNNQQQRLNITIPWQNETKIELPILFTVFSIYRGPVHIKTHASK